MKKGFVRPIPVTLKSDRNTVIRFVEGNLRDALRRQAERAPTMFVGIWGRGKRSQNFA